VKRRETAIEPSRTGFLLAFSFLDLPFLLLNEGYLVFPALFIVITAPLLCAAFLWLRSLLPEAGAPIPPAGIRVLTLLPSPPAANPHT
jgi:hypothetical protein